MPEVKTYKLPPTRLVPNSPYPLIHYPGFLSREEVEDAAGECSAASAYDVLAANGWRAQWIARYGATQDAHYHSRTHECMAVLSGSATIRFGVADTHGALAGLGTTTTTADGTDGTGDTGTTHSPSDVEAEEASHEHGGIEVEARVGDVFVLPAGLAHKTFNPSPEMPFTWLTPGDGHGLAETEEEKRDEDGVARAKLAAIRLSGFTMLGAYPVSGGAWDFARGGESEGRFDEVWSVPPPELDPALGASPEGLCGLWK